MGLEKVRLLDLSDKSRCQVPDPHSFHRLTVPVRTISDVPCSHSNTMCIFSPDEQLILTGVNTGQPQDETGAVAIFDQAKGEVRIENA